MPLHPSTSRVLADYAKRRDRNFGKRPDSKLKSPALAFFAMQNSNPYTARMASDDLRQRAHEFWRTKWIPMIRRTAEKFQREAPNSRVVLLENATHYLFQDREQQVVDEMDKFYASITPRP